jgi:glycosyltransferase involved in cell wall biosynthesis
MKILFNCISSISGGGRTYLRNLSVLLKDKFAAEGQHELLFLAYSDQEELLSGVPISNIIWIPSARPGVFRRMIWEQLNLPSMVSQYNFDVIFTPSQVARIVSNVKNVLMIRNMEPFLFQNYKYSTPTWIRNRLLSTMSARCLSKADRVIAVSQFAADYLSQIDVSKERITTIYHGSPTYQLSASLNLNTLRDLGTGNNFILTCGSMLPYRRYEDVITSFNLCIPNLPENMKLVIVGSGTDQGYAKLIQEMIKRSPDPSRILMFGNVSWDIMVKLYDRCTLCVMATEIEACPNIALEAMAAGCLIIASNRPPLPEMFNGCTLSYEARNIKSLSQAILKAFEDKNLGIHLKSKALQRSKEFSWVTCVEKTYSALTDW